MEWPLVCVPTSRRKLLFDSDTKRDILVPEGRVPFCAGRDTAFPIHWTPDFEANKTVRLLVEVSSVKGGFFAVRLATGMVSNYLDRKPLSKNPKDCIPRQKRLACG